MERVPSDETVVIGDQKNLRPQGEPEQKGYGGAENKTAGGEVGAFGADDGDASPGSIPRPMGSGYSAGEAKALDWIRAKQAEKAAPEDRGHAALERRGVLTPLEMI